jgi:death on curing protein
LAIEYVHYLSYTDALYFHIKLMREHEEVRYGVFERPLVESALARPQQAAAYENADVFRQAATLCFGLIKNHPWVGGNKRTATHLTELFLKANGWLVAAEIPAVVELVLAIEADQFTVDEIEHWYRIHSQPR